LTSGEVSGSMLDMKIKWRKKSITPEDILKRNIKIVEDYNLGLSVKEISIKYGFKDLRQVFNILVKMEKLPEETK
jgi:hypothetical protein